MLVLDLNIIASDPGRPNERVKMWIHGNKSSLAALEQQLVHVLEAGSSVVSFGGLYVHVRRRGADFHKQHDHHMFAYPLERKELFCDAISQHLTNRPPERRQQSTTFEDFSALAYPLSLAGQFAMIGVIPNDARKPYYGMHGRVSVPKHVGMDNHLLFQRSKSREKTDVPIRYPTSLRNRLLYFSLKGDLKMLDGLMDYWAAGCPEQTDTGLQPLTKTSSNKTTRKRKHYFTAPVDIMTSTDSQDNDIDCDYRTVFYHYQHRLRLDGVVIWRVRHKKGGVFILNAVSMLTTQLVSNSYEHVAYSVVGHQVRITRCSCSVFSHLYDVCQHETQKEALLSTEAHQRMCPHGRFLLTYLSELCVNPSLLDTDHQSALYQKIKQAQSLGDVVVLPEHDGRCALKMSVKGLHNNVLSFVHLCPDRDKLTCMSGGCSHLLQNKKTSTILNKLDTTDQKQLKQMCPHLLQLRQRTDKWLQFCKTAKDNQDELTQLDNESSQLSSEENNPSQLLSEENNPIQQIEAENTDDASLKIKDRYLVFDHNTGLWRYIKCLGTGKSLAENSSELTE